MVIGSNHNQPLSWSVVIGSNHHQPLSWSAGPELRLSQHQECLLTALRWKSQVWKSWGHVHNICKGSTSSPAHQQHIIIIIIIIITFCRLLPLHYQGLTLNTNPPANHNATTDWRAARWPVGG